MKPKKVTITLAGPQHLLMFLERSSRLRRGDSRDSSTYEVIINRALANYLCDRHPTPRSEAAHLRAEKLLEKGPPAGFTRCRVNKSLDRRRARRSK